MKKEKPFIHIFRTPGGFYIYDVNRNTIIRTPEAVYRALEGENYDHDSVRKLKDMGFLSSKRVSEVLHPASDTLKYHLENKIKMVTLQVTQQCNLRCEYCVYSEGYYNRSHSNKRMSLEMAKKGIDFLIAHSRDNSSAGIGFYGGEPLLEIELIKKCVAYAEERAEGKDLKFTITTNAILLEDSIVEYLMEHNISLMISLDGPKEIHDKHRRFAGKSCGSFDIVMGNIEHIKEKYPEFYRKISFSVVMDPQNDFGCINEFFTNFDTIKDARKNASFISDRYTKESLKSDPEFFADWSYEVFKIYLHKLDRLDKKYVSRLLEQHYDNLKRLQEDNLKPRLTLPDRGHHGGPCIPGAQRLFINADGDFYPCERVSEDSCVMKIGNINTGFELDKVQSLLNVGKLTEESCKNCWAFNFCYMCAAFADDLNELSGEKKSSRCGSVRYSTEKSFRDYCTLKELGHEFDEEEIAYIIQI